SQAAYFFKAEQKSNPKEKLSKDVKLQVLQSLEGHSKRECEKILLELSPENQSLCPERVKTVSPERTQITVTIDHATLNKLQRIQELASHKLKDKSLATVLDFVTTELLNRLDPERVTTTPELEAAQQNDDSGGRGRLLHGKKLSEDKKPNITASRY